MLRTWRCLLVVFLLCTLGACRTHSIMGSASQEKAFQAQYVDKPFYTSIVLRPYDAGEAYLIDLSGELALIAFETPRAPITVPLGTPITITSIGGEHIVAHIEGYARPFWFRTQTKAGTLDTVAAELAWVLSETPPLEKARPHMRPFIARQEVTRGMSRREVYMSWGQPDQVNSSPGPSGYLEEWIYFDRQMHLFLNGGFVTNWQQF